jgi:hypothetical protein
MRFRDARGRFIRRPTRRFDDLTGRRFGRLRVLRYAGTTKKGSQGDTTRKWKCRCRCRVVVFATTSDLMTGDVRSCGCLRRGQLAARNYRHGMRHTTEYNSYRGAKERCTNPNHVMWSRYGGRGIRFRFKSFVAFYAEVGPKPSPSMTIDRKDNDGDYVKGNVRWATRKTQRLNSSACKR